MTLAFCICYIFGCLQDSNITIVFGFLALAHKKFWTRILALAAEVLAFLGAHQRHLLLQWLHTHPGTPTLIVSCILLTFPVQSTFYPSSCDTTWPHYHNLDGNIVLSFDPSGKPLPMNHIMINDYFSCRKCPPPPLICQLGQVFIAFVASFNGRNMFTKEYFHPLPPFSNWKEILCLGRQRLPLPLFGAVMCILDGNISVSYVLWPAGSFEGSLEGEG